jgi:hypothetical protein
MALQGTSPSLQGGSGLTLGSASSPQKATSLQNSGGQVVPWATGVLGQQNTANVVNGPVVSTPDPYAAYGGTAAYNNLKSTFANQKSNIYGTANDAAGATASGLQNSILDLVDSLRSGQTSIDNRGVNNDLARQRGVADINAAVNRGIQSGGVTLANKNATDSSAAGAIARAYGQIGQRQLSDVGNQYELENQDISLAQQDLDTQRAAGLRRIDSGKQQAVNSIVTDARNSLAQLDAAMANASLPDRIAIDAEKNNIRNQVLQTLSQYDGQLQQGVNGVQAMNGDARQAEATRRNQLGQAPEASFDYTTDTPVELQGTGPSASNLPIFTYKKNNNL